MNNLDSPPNIKSEAGFNDSFSVMSGYTNYNQTSWPNTNNGSNNYDFLNGGNGARSTFGASSNAFGDDELADFIDFDQGDTQPQSPQPQFNASNTQQNMAHGMHGYMSMSMPAPARRQHSYINTDMYAQTPPTNSTAHGQWGQNQGMRDGSNMAHFQQPQAPFGGAQAGVAQSLQGNGMRGNYNGRQTALSPSARDVGGAVRQFGTSDVSSHGEQQSMGEQPRRRANSSSQWEARLGVSLDSEPGIETPLTSPMSVPHVHSQLSSIMENEKSPPSRIKGATGGLKSVSVPAGSSREEQKKAKRRNAHNVVEQKRRDKINERIQELSRLVPGHRLEDNKIKKQLASHARGATAAAGGSSMSPPTANPLRKGSVMAQSVDERDKTKGNSLDGAVAWMKDLMWMLHRKLEQEAILHETIHELGGQIPYQDREDERRMRSELMEAFGASGVDNFEYSRGHGTGLWVPEYTDRAGQPLQQNTAPDFFEYAAKARSSQAVAEPDTMWNNFTPESARDSLEFRDHDEFQMDMS